MRGFRDKPTVDPERELQSKIALWTVIGIVIAAMIYSSLFGDLKEVLFFGSSTENAQALW